MRETRLDPYLKHENSFWALIWLFPLVNLIKKKLMYLIWKQ